MVAKPFTQIRLPADPSAALETSSKQYVDNRTPSDPAAGTAGLRTLGTGATQACAGNDSRLSNSRTPTAHASSHATAGSDPITPSDIGAAATTHSHAAGDVTSGTFAIGRIPTGTTSSTVCIGNDARLSDSRTPTAHTHAATDINTGTLDAARLPLVRDVPSALTYAASLTPVWTDGAFRECTMTGDATLNAPTSPANGAKWFGRFYASAAQRTLTLASALRKPAHIGASLVIASGRYADVGLIYTSTAAEWAVAAAQVYP